MLDFREAETRSGIDWKKWGPLLLSCVAVAVFLFLRLRNLGHTLNWDEARFVLYNRSFVRGLDDYWRTSINIHPHLYLWICAFMNKGFRGGERSFELVSVGFSLGTLLLLGDLGRRVFDRWTGALAMFFLAVLPASTVIDTWIKEDAAVAFFITLTAYLFMRKKYAWSGIALGAAMLTKETGIFALSAIGVYALTCWRRDEVIGAAKAGSIGAAISFWWYFFESSSVSYFGSFFLGNRFEITDWHQPWHYYASGLPEDLGWCVTIVAVVGFIVCFYRRFRGERAFMLPVAWLVPIYAFLSFSYGKPYWMVTAALPAAALLAAIGMAETVRWVGGHISRARLARAAQVLLAGGLLTAAFVSAAVTSGSEYNASRNNIYWAGTLAARRDAELLAEKLGEGDKVLMIFNMEDRWNPELVYYLGDTDLLPGGAWMLKSQEDLSAYVKATGSNWVYIGEITYDEDLEALRRQMEEELQVEEVFYSDSCTIFKLSR